MILNSETELRTSLGLKEFYDEHYKPPPRDLRQVLGFDDYDASFDYNMFWTEYKEETGEPINIQRPLQDAQGRLNIPTYLLEMKTQVNGFPEFFASSIERFRGMEQYHDGKPRGCNYYRRLVENSLLMLVKYKSTVPSAT